MLSVSDTMIEGSRAGAQRGRDAPSPPPPATLRGRTDTVAPMESTGPDAPRAVLPPPPPPLEVLAVRPQARPGELTPAWRVVFIVGWIGVILSLVAVWKSGRTLGLAPWWLGPSGDPHHLLVNLIPFLAPVAMVVMAARRDRYLPVAGIVASLCVAAVAAGDVEPFPRLAVVEFGIAAAALLVSVASFAGLLRVADDEPIERRADGAIAEPVSEPGTDGDVVAAPASPAQ
jgi:hypothetical protein